jgi:glycosyltransferase involved in cell wall biosynthesis
MAQRDHPKISVVIPTYNEEFYIKDTLNAVKNQKCTFAYEIIIIDGKSSDNTVSILKEFAKKVQYAELYVSPKRGKAFQLNYGVSKTNSELLLFLDADTLIDPFFLQKIYKKFEKNKNLFACSARFKYYDEKAINFKLGSFKFTITPYFFINLASHIYYFFKNLFGYPELTGMNLIVRKKIFYKAGGFKNPPNSLGIDKVFTDSLLYLKRKLKKGKIKTLTFLSVLTSGRHLTFNRSIKRLNQYFKEKDTYYHLATKNSIKNSK